MIKTAEQEAEKLREIARKFEPKLRTSLINAFNTIRNEQTLKSLREILQDRGVNGLIETLNNMEDVITAEIRESLQDAVNAGGRTAINFIPNQGILVDTFTYNTFNPYTAQFVNQYELDLIQQISYDSRTAIRTAITNDVFSGRNPIATARDFRNNIGLTGRQLQAVRNYRNYLETLNPVALRRTLRDRRFDGPLTRAIQNQKRLKAAKIDQMVNRYRDRYLKYRAETIARTEAMRAVSIGQDMALKQMIDQDAIDTDNLRQFWVFVHDGRTRDPHKTVMQLNKGGVRLDEPFRTELGPLRYPRDPNGSAANTINCRCVRVFRYVVEEE